MRTVFVLLLTYFGGTRLARFITVLGLAMIGAGTAGIAHFSRYLLMGPKSHDMALATEAILWILPALGLVMTFLGGALMPVMVGRLLRSRQIHTLPHGRLKLLASALLSPALVALIFAVMVWDLYRTFPLGQVAVFEKAWVVAFLSFCLMYAVLWLMSKMRSALGMLAGAMLVVLSLALPYEFIQLPDSSLRWLVTGGLLAIACGVAAVFLAPRLSRDFPATFARLAMQFHSKASAASRPIGNAVDLLLGTSNPWLLAVGQIVPFLVATRFIGSPKIWLFYLGLFSVMSGAFSSAAPARSRSLWLRTSWARDELFTRVERSFWRQNSYSIGVLVVLLMAIGSPQNFPLSLLVIGASLIFLGTAVSSYLGLMMTKNIGWLEALCAVAAMLLMMALAVAASDARVPLSAVIGGIVGLALMTIAFRLAAKRRWAKIDWMLCRPLS